MCVIVEFIGLWRGGCALTSVILQLSVNVDVNAKLGKIIRFTKCNTYRIFLTEPDAVLKFCCAELMEAILDFAFLDSASKTFFNNQKR